jgi:two-component system KDP operon response regulator KdpE
MSLFGSPGGAASGTALVCGEIATAADGLERTITADGWKCVVAQNVERAGWLASVRNFRLVVLVGESPAWCAEVLAAVRPRTPTPILVMSPLPDEQPRLLDLGADMVLGTGCDKDLLRSAIQAMVRRVPSTAPRLRHLEADGLRLDLWSRSVTLDDRLVDLSPTQFELLHYLMAHAQVVVRHHALIRAVWSWKYTDERNALRIHINRLRRRLGEASGRPRFIRCLRGIGYTFIQPVSEFADDEDTARNAGLRDGGGLLMEGELRKLWHALLGAGTRSRACAVLVESAVAEGLCDGAAVFARRPGSDELHLVAHAGMPPEWEDAISRGAPPAKPFVAGETFDSPQTRAYVDVGRHSDRYGQTARLLADAKLPVVLSVPLIDRDGAWGQLGCARRADSAFTSAHRLILEAAGCLLGALFADDAALAPVG